ncbi:unnamed protein product, partial [Lampetra planeri]
RGMRPGEAASAGDGSVRRRNRLPNIKEFSSGDDWNAFTCRFESIILSVKWTEDEALEALPTLLDDVSLAVFRSILSGRKKTLRDAFAEMAEIYEPSCDAQRKFMHRRRGVNDSPLAYRSALVVLAMAAYPDSTADLLDPLILTKMLELSKEMDISLPPVMSAGVDSVECSAERAEPWPADAVLNLPRSVWIPPALIKSPSPGDGFIRLSPATNGYRTSAVISIWLIPAASVGSERHVVLRAPVLPLPQEHSMALCEVPHQ